ncbi:hypothetical protein ACWFMI_23635 [Nocardiopsis terrae]|uniref:hypothetical protein n=1 Tax=Streptomyces sp. NPDC057554 TaxID=3350538 RepID=UPI003695DF92
MGISITSTGTGSFHIIIGKDRAQALNLFLHQISYWPSARAALSLITTLLGLTQDNIQDTEGINITLTPAQAKELNEAFNSFLPRVKKGETEDGFRFLVCETIGALAGKTGNTLSRDNCICLG